MRRKTIDTIPVLTDTMKNILSAFSKSRPLPSSLVQRANIILASQGALNQTISAEVGLHYNHVATWRNRFLDALPALREIETSAPEKLEGGDCLKTQKLILKVVDSIKYVSEKQNTVVPENDFLVHSGIKMENDDQSELVFGRSGGIQLVLYAGIPLAV